MADELERALRQRDAALLAEKRNPRGVSPKKADPLDLGVGLRERLALLNQTLNPVESIGSAMGAGEQLLSGGIDPMDRVEALGDMLSGVAGVLPFGALLRGGKAAASVADNVAEGATSPGAVIRPDDVFRGHGTPKVSYDVATKPYAVRLTGMDQIEDMIASGLVRPKPGGYGKQGSASLYFGEADSLDPTVFTKLSDTKGARLVADSARIAGREGPVSLDDLLHVFVLKDGKEVDILDEIRRKNREFDDVQKFARGGVVKGSYLDNDPYD